MIMPRLLPHHPALAIGSHGDRAAAATDKPPVTLTAKSRPLFRALTSRSAFSGLWAVAALYRMLAPRPSWLSPFLCFDPPRRAKAKADVEPNCGVLAGEISALRVAQATFPNRQKGR